MKLYLLRHGEAEPYCDQDETRQLTPSGREHLVRVLAQKAQGLTRPDAVWVSPYVRTQQTADIVKQTLSLPAKIFYKTNAVTPGASVATMIEKMQSSPFETLMLITHQPFLGQLFDTLGGFERGRYVFGTSAFACLTMDVAASGCAEFNWMVQ